MRTLFSHVMEKRVHEWLFAYLQHRLERTARLQPARKTRHLIFALCDHFEPLAGGVPERVGVARVRRWQDQYPPLARPFRDADGFPPQHSFFFPGDEYRPAFLDGLTELVGQGLGEVEFHLHHHDDTRATLRRKILESLSLFARHGHLSRDSDGSLRYGFIHGNWCLANARADGDLCGVDDELTLLHETGCFADYTFPAAPDESQPSIVNRIYWPEGDLSRRRAYDRGEPARVGDVRRDRILMIQGPLGLGLRSGRVPVRIDAAHLTHVDPPTLSRLRRWVAQEIHVLGRPEWIFVKVHTHGATEDATRALLGRPARAFHRSLRRHFNDGRRWRLHYVTAREMYNIAVAAMEGLNGNPGRHRDHMVGPPPVARRG